MDPTFDRINVFQSIAESTYNAFTATLTKRMTHGWMTQATYTLARGEDNAPLTGTYVVGSGDDRVSDPTNLDRDKGVTPFNQTHTLSVSAVVAPQVGGSGVGAALLNNNQLGIILQANSGLPFNIRSNLDLNLDGVLQRPAARRRAQRRPAGPRRQPRPALLALHPDRARWRGELFFEAKNLFNTREHRRRQPAWSPTSALGVPAAPLQFDGNGLPGRRQERLRSAHHAARGEVLLLRTGRRRSERSRLQPAVS